MRVLKDGDYHLHTVFSDGKLSPEQVVLWAKEKGVSEIAITDHDGTDGVARAKAKGKEIGVPVIGGVEFSCKIKLPQSAKHTEVHILGYGMDLQDEAFCAECRRLREKRNERNIKLFKAMREQGIDVTAEQVISYKNKNAGLIEEPYEEGSLARVISEYVGKPDIARFMVAKGYAEDVRKAFDRYFDLAPLKRINKEKLDAGRAIELINGAGGEAVLAHPGKIKSIGEKDSEEFWEKLRFIVENLKAAGIKGLECYHPAHDEAFAEKMKEMADACGLFASRGSDFHGDA